MLFGTQDQTEGMAAMIRFGGEIELAAGADGVTSSPILVVSVPLLADGSLGEGFGGDGGVMALGAVGDVRISGEIRANGAGAGGWGGGRSGSATPAARSGSPQT